MFQWQGVALPSYLGSTNDPAAANKTRRNELFRFMEHSPFSAH